MLAESGEAVPRNGRGLAEVAVFKYEVSADNAYGDAVTKLSAAAVERC
jgi:hypothetical protein